MKVYLGLKWPIKKNNYSLPVSDPQHSPVATLLLLHGLTVHWTTGP